ncbi:hypothetical protein [Natrononativus amylolyticus]|nr:hypothetical protein [Natrononativus amylolyticus]
MTRPGEHERRPFFACEACGVVYARFSVPDRCGVCESELFVRVLPDEASF